MSYDENTLGPFIKIFSNKDDLLRLVGTILSTPKSRLIYSLLIEKEMYAREIAKFIEQKQNPHLPGVSFHLKKMVKSGLVTFETKLQRKHGKRLKYYRAIPFIIIAPPEFVEKIKKDPIRCKLLKDALKFTLTVIPLCATMIIHGMSFFGKPFAKNSGIKYIKDKTLHGLFHKLYLLPILSY